MGEATKCLSSEFRARYPGIPWREMAGFRDVLIHDYINIDLDRVWEIIETDLNELEQSIGEILNELGIKFPNHSQ